MSAAVDALAGDMADTYGPGWSDVISTASQSGSDFGGQLTSLFMNWGNAAIDHTYRQDFELKKMYIMGNQGLQEAGQADPNADVINTDAAGNLKINTGSLLLIGGIVLVIMMMSKD